MSISSGVETRVCRQRGCLLRLCPQWYLVVHVLQMEMTYFSKVC